MNLLDVVKSSMRTCRNCCWWEVHGTESEGFCRTDLNMDYMSSIKTRQSLPYMWAKHDEVRTRPDFGCNQFEAGAPELKVTKD